MRSRMSSFSALLLFLVVTILGLSGVCVGDNDITTNAKTLGGINQQGHYLVRGTKLHLTCKHAQNDDAVVWYRADPNTPLQNDSVYTISQSSNDLTINRPDSEHAGNYTCQVGQNTVTITVYMNATIDGHEGGSKNQLEGDTLKLVCKAVGYPKPTVEWLKDEELMIADDRITFEDENGVTGSRLVVSNLTFSDKGEYRCVAKNNNHAEATMKFNVRVKDKYAALWPFLGICAEVAILCTIIFIYEKRRSKPEFDDEADDRADRKEAHDVRHRK